MKFIKSVLICIVICLIIACSKPETGHSISNTVETIDYDDGDGNTGDGSEALSINEQLQPYYDRFIDEMLARGEDLRDIPISILLVSPTEQSNNLGYCGLGYYNYDGTGNSRVEIVYNSRCWINLTDIEKENLMFHEFGHALLNRPHISSPHTFPNGSARSIMCSSGYCSGFGIYSIHQDTQRSFYLDELLDVNIDAPYWSASKSSSTTLEEDDITASASGWVSESVLQDNNTSNPYSYSVSSADYLSSSYALAITATANSQSNSYGNWYKDFVISDFDDCSNIVAEINFKTTAYLSNGYLNVLIDLFDDVNSETEFHRYYTEPGTTEVGSGYYRIQTKAICIPNETAKIRVRLYMKSESNATAYFDDLRIILFE
ncbi:hypothetical protein [Psychroserpens algicola]|uniref:Dual-action HEIGH metallo-peptidase n=1 Tax=Psychroserpens algicola TaxID=1719034 RepID=A0ABT0H410_9FLAO|nr:hypothetical protein [Psychroserpens algicola]MCK8479118.1 hypothetical protein [Psychroserpens algicola]